LIQDCIEVNLPYMADIGRRSVRSLPEQRSSTSQKHLLWWTWLEVDGGLPKQCDILCQALEMPRILRPLYQANTKTVQKRCTSGSISFTGSEAYRYSILRTDRTDGRLRAFKVTQGCLELQETVLRHQTTYWFKGNSPVR